MKVGSAPQTDTGPGARRRTYHDGGRWALMRYSREVSEVLENESGRVKC